MHFALIQWYKLPTKLTFSHTNRTYLSLLAVLYLMTPYMVIQSCLVLTGIVENEVTDVALYRDLSHRLAPSLM